MAAGGVLFRTPHRFDTDVDISSIRFWSEPFEQRERSFARLRQTSPVSWHPQLETPGLRKADREAGFWAITTAADVAYVSRHHELFSSQYGQVSLRPTPFHLEQNMLVLDPPAHTRFRRAVSAGFTPVAVAALRPVIERRARQIVLRAAHAREFDLVEAVSSQLPMRTIADALGVPDSEHERFVAAARTYTGSGGLRYSTDPAEVQAEYDAQSAYLRGLLASLAAFRLRVPGDDLISRLVSTRDDPFTAEQIVSTGLLMIVAGDDTTRHTITLALLALDAFPDERARLLEEFDGRFEAAFDELLRFTSPIQSFARSAVDDVELAGRSISAGDKVALFYCSANRDEVAFDRPEQLRLDRRPNRHSAFGGGGVHFCLGSSLAKAQIRAVLHQVLTRLEGLELGEPDYAFGEFTRGVTALPARVRASR